MHGLSVHLQKIARTPNSLRRRDVISTVCDVRSMPVKDLQCGPSNWAADADFKHIFGIQIIKWNHLVEGRFRQGIYLPTDDRKRRSISAK